MATTYICNRDPSKDIYEEVSYDTTKPKFDEVVIASDLAISSTANTNVQLFLYYNKQTNSLNISAIGNTFSGAGAVGTNGICYDTTTNIINLYVSSSVSQTGNNSLPIALITRENKVITSIDQVFNGFGYIGSTVFALPNVKGLVPNGRNEDGSLKNIEFTVESVLTQTFPSTYSYSGALIYAYNTLAAWGESDYSYNEEENFVKFKGGNYPAIRIGNIDLSTGRIASFTSKTAFHALDYNDKSVISSRGTPDYSAGISFSSGSTVQTSGIIAGISKFNGGVWNVSVNNIKVVSGNSISNAQSPFVIVVDKGDVVSYSAVEAVMFYPLKGVN